MTPHNLSLLSRSVFWGMLIAMGTTASAQCDVYVSTDDYVIRTSGNTVQAHVESYLTGCGASLWQPGVWGVLSFNNGAGIADSGAVAWGSFGGSVARDYAIGTSLQPRGTGEYESWGLHYVYCPAAYCGYDRLAPDWEPYADNWNGWDVGTRNIQRPVINTPHQGFGANFWAFWYLQGLPDQSGYKQTVDVLGVLNLGPCTNCGAPTYGWQIVDQPSGADALSFSSTSTVGTTLTSQRKSTGGVYDISVVFSVDGFWSEKLWINLNTPDSIYRAATRQIQNPGSCPSPNIAGGYITEIDYAGVDLWGYALAPIDVNEKNDMFQNDALTVIGWMYAPGAIYNSIWYASLWGYYVFTDSIGGWNCTLSAWTPQPIQQQTPLGATKVMHTPQTFRVGAQTPGSGIQIGSFIQRWYTDHGDADLP